LRVAGGRGAGGALAVAGLELLAAAFVLVVGAALVAGLWTSTTGS
jgi:nickel/cobalt exporter